MQRLSAIDAISPAFTRTHTLLFKPFKIGRSWKLAATAYLALAGSFFFPFPLVYAGVAMFIPGIPRAIIPFLWAAALVGTAVYLGIYYCCVRLQLVEFEMIVTTAKMIAPMWRKYAAKVWPWLGAKVVLGLFALAFMVPIFISTSKGFIAIMSTMAAQGKQPDPAAMSQMMASLLGFYALIFGLFLIPKILNTLLDDFVMPFFLMEDLPVLTAVQRGFTVFAADPVSCVLYLLMKYFLALVGYMMQSVAMQIAMIPFGIVFGIGFVLGAVVFRHAGDVGAILGVAGAVILGALALVVICYLAIGAFGYLLLLLDSYAIYFLGGRYPLLGNLLEPGPGGPFTPPPVYPSAEERRDEDGGPPMPMNPAVA